MFIDVAHAIGPDWFPMNNLLPFILVKNSVEKVILDNQVTNEIIIKALSPVVVTCSKNKIDEEYDEIFLDKGSCVQLLKLNNIWYIVSSDGLKLN